MKKLEGNIVDVIKNQVYSGVVHFNEKIVKIERNNRKYNNYIAPGFIDAHIHIESSMLTPSKFAEVVIPHGTVAVISDPHEIANVLGVKGIEFMIEDSKKVPLKIFFTCPSCVPATTFETSGAVISPKEVEMLMKRKEIVALGEMMNFPGVINEIPEVMKKIEIAKKYNKPIDGHAPLLTGKGLKKYIKAGISTDHECTLLEEAEEKQRLGMKVMIREGSSAKNMEKLIKLKNAFAFVCDDRDCVELMENGHVDSLLRKAVQLGKNSIEAIKMVTINPASHYDLPFGSLEVGKPTHLVVMDNLKNFQVKEVYIDGRLVAKDGKIKFKKVRKIKRMNKFNASLLTEEQLAVNISPGSKVKAIQAYDNQLLTDKLVLPANKFKEVQKLVVYNRYLKANPAVAFIKGFGLKDCAIAQTIAHDSHNIISVGSNDRLLVKAINSLIKLKGGIVVTTPSKTIQMKLEVAGLMGIDQRKIYKKMKDMLALCRKHGCRMKNPFLTLSFMALLVIPHLKLSDKGLFDSDKFSFVELCET
ncbi:MAG: adenine deaminase [Candidatus Aenigmarchaeota archaeon]|nr:adenine deaminase [Candidatus Aenigmarchaeota archaeon]